MARRVFRRSRKISNKTMNGLNEIGVCPLEMSGMERLCAGLSEDDIESLSTFRIEANLFKAKSSDESIGVSEALRYLKAAKFNSTKAIEIFKNYHKHRESYHLDNLRPHRNPLSNEIGSRKLEIVGTSDSEGSPIVLFTVARHDMKSSDHKAAVQLVFYTLDQLAENDPENGVVVIMDMRDISITSFDVRYVTGMLSIFRDGYPIYIKAIFIVNAPIWVKTQVAISKAFKQDTNKIQYVNAAELTSKFFVSSQLPHSLGGSYIPGSGSHRAPPTTKPPPPPSSRPHHHHNSDGVNTLVKAFEGAHLSTTTTSSGSGTGPGRPHPPPTSTKPKPVPPAKCSRVNPLPPPKSRPTVSNGSQSPVVKKMSGSSDTGHKSESPRTRVPLFPRGTTAGKSSASSAPQQPTKPPSLSNSPSFPGKASSPTRGLGVKDHHHTGGGGEGGGIASQIRNFEKRSQSQSDDRHAPGSCRDTPSIIGNGSSSGGGGRSAHKDERTRSGSAGSHSNVSPSQSKQDSPNRVKKPLIPVKLLAETKENFREKRSKDNSNNTDGHSSRHTHITMATTTAVKGERVSPRVPPPHMHTQQIHEVSPYASLSVAMPTSNQSSAYYEEGSEYENVDIGPLDGHGQQQAAHTPTDYENVVMKPSSKHHAHQRPRPTPQHQPSKPVTSDCYENVEFSPLPSQSLAGKVPRPPSDEHVSDDDDVLFGKEGPPGMKRDEVIYENFGPDAGNKHMTVDELERHIKKKEKKGLSAEYLKIKNEPLCGEYKACRLRCNLAKNRYKDVVCYDENRVVLRSTPGVEGSDYIHANYVSGYNKQNAFILTQGPKDKTVVDFWRMIWESNLQVIVMITKCVELGKRKCAQYWPETVESEGMTHGHVTIHMTKVVNAEGYDVHTLKVSSEGEERTIKHYQFLAWPDYGVPSSGQHVLQLLFSVRKAQARKVQQLDLSRLHLPPHGPPILVHCSAGVGRSGAFCTLDISVDELKDQNRVNVQGIVRQMRTERAYAVQTDEQYEFCYRTILEYAKSQKSVT